MSKSYYKNVLLTVISFFSIEYNEMNYIIDNSLILHYFECSFKSFAKICSLLCLASFDNFLRTAEQTNPVTVKDVKNDEALHS